MEKERKERELKILHGGTLPEWYSKGAKEVQPAFNDRFCYSSCEDSYSSSSSTE